MASGTYSAEALVLRKITLGESDLIVRMMDEHGRLLEAVAKGARKPQGSLSGRIELFNRVHIHCAEGKSLDVLKEARLQRGGEKLHTDPVYGAAAACIAEFASRTIQPELEVRRYFDLTDTAFDALEHSDETHLPLIVAAYVFKASSMIGMRPSFGRCAICGAEVTAEGSSRVSYIDGGNVCADCAPGVDSMIMDANVLLWADALLASTFDEIIHMDADLALGMEMMSVAATWSLTQVDVRLKSTNSLAEYVAMLCD